MHDAKLLLALWEKPRISFWPSMAMPSTVQTHLLMILLSFSVLDYLQSMRLATTSFKKDLTYLLECDIIVYAK